MKLERLINEEASALVFQVNSLRCSHYKVTAPDCQLMQTVMQTVTPFETKGWGISDFEHGFS